MDEEAEVQESESKLSEVSEVRFQPSPAFEALHYTHPGLGLC